MTDNNKNDMFDRAILETSQEILLQSQAFVIDKMKEGEKNGQSVKSDAALHAFVCMKLGMYEVRIKALEDFISNTYKL